MDSGVQLYGRHTWEHFARLWPSRTGHFADRMNAVAKRVATRSNIDKAAWANSEAIDGDLLTWVKNERDHRDVVVIGSLTLVHQLAEANLVDEYRLITFPTVVGTGDRLFATGRPAEFRFIQAEPADPELLTVLTAFHRDRAGEPR